MSGYIRLISGGALTAVFVICIVMFATNFAIDNDSDISIVDDSRYSNLNTELRSNLSTLSDQAETSQDILFKTTLESGDEHSGSGGQFKIGPVTAVSLAVSSFNTAFFSVFGREFGFIATAFVTMLTFIIGYFTIKAWLGRSPE